MDGMMYFGHIRRTFRGQASNNMDRCKSRGGKSHRKEEKKQEDQRRNKMQMREKAGKSRNTLFPMLCGCGGSKSRLAKAAGAEPSGEMRDKKLHGAGGAVASNKFRNQNAKNTSVSNAFGSSDVEKVRAIVA